MLKVNTARIAEFNWSSPEGEIIGAGKEISEELGRKPDSTDLNERHPFDVEICRIPPGKTPYTYHSHSAQWEFYHVISGSGVVCHTEGTTPIEVGDAFLFNLNEPHQTCISLDAYCHRASSARQFCPCGSLLAFCTYHRAQWYLDDH